MSAITLPFIQSATALTGNPVNVEFVQYFFAEGDTKIGFKFQNNFREDVLYWTFANSTLRDAALADVVTNTTTATT